MNNSILSYLNMDVSVNYVIQPATSFEYYFLTICHKTVHNCTVQSKVGKRERSCQDKKNAFLIEYESNANPYFKNTVVQTGFLRWYKKARMFKPTESF